MKKISIAFSLISILFMTGCGPAAKTEATPLNDGSQVLAFEVGHDVQSAPYTHVIVTNVQPSAIQVRKLLFRAPHTGTFRLIENNVYGMGTACTSQGQNGDFSLNFDYKLKDFRTNQFTISANESSNSYGTSIFLNAHDELLVSMFVEGKSVCSMIEVLLMALFN